ncbi:MAG: T9SS type A sorting domain-containing protein [Bacteroidia bacterium]|nr:T9SS type A sorting domain-containing protein [Bacteroidia bacterium]
MKQKRLFIVMTLLCLLATHARAQVPCAFDTLQQIFSTQPGYWPLHKGHENRIDYYRNHPSEINEQYRPGPNSEASTCFKTRFMIPVVVHIDSSGGTVNVTSTQVQDQLDAVNTIMKNYGIQLCLAQKKPNGTSFSGINYFNGASVDNRISYQLPSLTNILYYNPKKYLNIYIVPTILNDNYSTSTYGGYNNIFPGQKGLDGIVILHTRFGNYQTCSGCNLDANARGLVLVHELGHYLGLWHTFEGGCSGGNTAGTCSTQGDHCCDTRPVATQNFLCPLPTPSLSCSNTAYYTSSFAENRSNYMDYAEEPCKTNFTSDQQSIMYSSLLGPRSELVSGENLDTLGLACCFKTAWFTTNTNFYCTSDMDSIRLTAYQGASTYRWQIKDSVSGRTVFDTVTTSKIFTYMPDSAGKYNITLRTIYSSGDTVEMKRIMYIEISDCNTPIASTKGNWYFGQWAGLRFTTNGVFRDMGPWINQLPDNIFTGEGSVSISNPQGQLLFYAGGDLYAPGYMNVYNKKYKQFHTSPVKGDMSSAQTGIILPSPKNKQRYYLFTVSGLDANVTLSLNNSGFRYSIVDTTVIDLSDPNDPIYCEIDTPNFKDVPIKAPSGSQFHPVDSSLICGEMITAVSKCNGRDYWIIVVDRSANDSLYANYHKLLVYSLDSATGVTFSHVSSFRLSIDGGNGNYAYGQLKASPDGTKLAAPGYVMEFNRITGAITIIDSMSAPAPDIWACSFSPNSKRLFYLVNIDAYTSGFHQYNLEDSSDVVIDTLPEFFGNAMQLGPDNKIYMAQIGLSQLGMISNPDEVYDPNNPSSIDYTAEGPKIGSNGIGGMCLTGLPNFMDAKYPSEIEKKIEYAQTGCFNFKFTNTVCCTETFKWYFGDGDSASGKTVNHTYDSLKYYYVMLIAGSDTLRDTIRVGIDQPIIAGSTNAICDTVHFNTYSVGNRVTDLVYQWLVDAPNQMYVDNYGGANVSWKQDSSYIRLKATSPGGCKDSSEVMITIRPPLTNYNISPSQIICYGTQPDTIVGDTPTGGTPPYRYQWFMSTDTSLIKVWTKLTNDTLIHYLPGGLYQTTYFTRVTGSGECPGESNVVEVKISRVLNDSIWKDTSDCDDILGSTPVSISGIQSYFWERSSNGTSWETISGETQKDLKYPVFFDTTHVRRIVTDSNACSSTSNVVIPAIFAGDITYSGDTLCTGNALYVSGNAPCSGNKTISYQWQYRKLGTTNYVNLGGTGTLQNYSHSSWTDSCYIIREMTSFGKFSYSDSVLIPMRPLLINYLLENGDTTCPGRNLHTIDGSFSCISTKYFFRWQTTTDTTGTWDDIWGATAYDYSPPPASVTTYYRRRMVYSVTSDTTYTNVYTISVMAPAISSQPSNVTVNDGGAASFSISMTDMTLLRWEKRTGTSPFYTWVTVAPGTSPYSFVTDLCMNGGVYRAVVFNHCTNAAEYSSEAVLTVNSLNYDLWAKDNESDIFASEPSTGFIWNSPDIWNRKNNDTSSVHENPEYRWTAPNYLRAIVRNTNNATSVPAKLFVYWTFASTGERWDRNWLSNTSNNDSVSGNWKTYYGTRKGLGGLIGEYNIPALAPSEVYKVSTSWIVPDPGIVVGDSNASNQADICFLSRIVTCTNPNYGMHVSETMSIGDNVRKNNNIITKNFVVYDALPGNGRVSWGGNGNPNDGASATGVLRLRAGNCDFFRYGYVILHLDPTLQNIWTNTDGSGYTVVDDSTLMVDTCVEVVMENIAYEAGQYGLLGVEFVMRNDYTTLSTFDAFYEFDLEEMLNEDTVSIGGIHYGVPMHIEPLPESGMQRRIPSDNKQAIVGKTSFHAYPNPFTDQLTINYHIPKEEQVNIVITNLLGQKVAIIENNTFKQSGIHKFTFNSAALKEGIYFINFTAGSYTQTQKVVLIR